MIARFADIDIDLKKRTLVMVFKDTDPLELIGTICRCSNSRAAQACVAKLNENLYEDDAED